jgi:hypothetical protein
MTLIRNEILQDEITWNQINILMKLVPEYSSSYCIYLIPFTLYKILIYNFFLNKKLV